MEISHAPRFQQLQLQHDRLFQMVLVAFLQMNGTTTTQAGKLPAISMAMANSYPTLTFDNSVCLYYNYNNQLMGNNLDVCTMAANSSGISVGYAGSAIALSANGLYTTPYSRKRFSGWRVPTLA